MTLQDNVQTISKASKTIIENLIVQMQTTIDEYKQKGLSLTEDVKKMLLAKRHELEQQYANYKKTLQDEAGESKDELVGKISEINKKLDDLDIS